MPPATMASTIIFSTCRPVGAFGIVRYRPSTALSCWRGSWPPAPISTPTTPTSGKFARSQMRFIVGGLDLGAERRNHRDAWLASRDRVHKLRWKATTKPCSSIFWAGLPHPSLHATASMRGLPLIGGNNVMATTIFMRAVVYPPAFTRLDRLSRYPGCIYAGQGHRLFREQPSCNLRAATLCDR